MSDAVKEGLMPNTFDYETAHSLFETGKIPFLMAGPGRWTASAPPVCLTLWLLLPRRWRSVPRRTGLLRQRLQRKSLLAQAFLTEYVATEEVMQELYETGLRPSAFKSVLETTDDPDLKAMGEAGANAMPMPNIPEMGSVWTAADNGITLAATG